MRFKRVIPTALLLLVAALLLLGVWHWRRERVRDQWLAIMCGLPENRLLWEDRLWWYSTPPHTLPMLSVLDEPEAAIRLLQANPWLAHEPVRAKGKYFSLRHWRFGFFYRRETKRTFPLESAGVLTTPRLVELLLKYGADPSRKGLINSAHTPLGAAIDMQRGDPARTAAYIRAMELLLQYKADDYNERDLQGYTLLDHTKSPEVAQLLRQYGAKTGAELEAEERP